MNEDYYVQRRAEVFELVSSMAVKPLRVLEVGCGAGFFTTNFTWPVEYYGVEINLLVAEKAKERISKVFVGSYEEVSHLIPDEFFDLIVCNDVIEHITNHDAFLRSIKLKLAIGGLMVGSVPNVRYIPHLEELLFKGEWRYRDSGVLDRTHFRFFTIKSISENFTKCGFEIVKITGLNPIKLRVFSLKKLIKYIFFRYLGEDTRFLQIGFVIKAI